jgi:hypothetical protein
MAKPELPNPTAEKRVVEQWLGPPLKKRMISEYFVKCDKCQQEISAPTLARLKYLFQSHYSFMHLDFAKQVKKIVNEALKE